MPHRAYDLVIKWDTESASSFSGRTYSQIYSKIEYYAKYRYYQYLPTVSAQFPEYLLRLNKWLDNVPSDEDKRTLMEFVPEIIFFGREEFEQLYQATFQGPITQWVIEELGLRFDDEDFESKLSMELHERTWYCPITDSMQISDFHHTNGIGGIDYRPPFRALAKFGDRNKIVSFMQNHRRANRSSPLKRIVLLEDFVGIGTQIEGAVDFAARLSSDISVLLVPLIICPEGSTRADHIVRPLKNAAYSPIVVLDPNSFINHTTSPQPRTLQKAIKDLAISVYNQVVGDGANAPRPYSPFGFPCPYGTGATVVMYSNTPANTLPLIQHESSSWNALFPRSARIR